MGIRNIIKNGKFIEVLKEGDFSKVSKWESSEGKLYIFKEYKAEYINEARREFLYLNTIKSDQVVCVTGFETEPQPALLMEYIQGEAVSPSIFSQSRKREIAISKLAVNVAKIHALGLCLNDFKPDNLIWSKDELYLIDLELTSLNLYYDGLFRGTPAYSAPEKILRNTNHLAADVFSLGMILFYLKHGKTVFDLVGPEDYAKTIAEEQRWTKQLEILENDPLIREALSYSPTARPSAARFARKLDEKNNYKQKGWKKSNLESYIFKSQSSAMEKILKKRTLNCHLEDEPQKIEYLLSLWSENENRKLLLLDEQIYITQPEEFFRHFPIGYRDKASYQNKFIEWLSEQNFLILLRRSKFITYSSFFDEIFQRTNALQIRIGEMSDCKDVAVQEVYDLFDSLQETEGNKKRSVLKELTTYKPFLIRIYLQQLFAEKEEFLKVNELVEFISWFQMPLPISLVETIWENWFVLIQDGIIQNKLILSNDILLPKAKHQGKTNQALIEKILEHTEKLKYDNLTAEIYYILENTEEAGKYWTKFIDELTRKQYYLSAYEYIQKIKQSILKNDLSFDLLKKEAFLARMCGYFQHSLDLYELLLKQSQGLMQAVISVDMAVVQQNLQKNEEAIISYKNAVDVFRVHKDWKSLFRAMNNLGVSYFELHRYSEAEQLFSDVLTEAKELNNMQFQTISYLNLADIQMKRGDWKKVVYYAEKAIGITKENQKWSLYNNGNILLAKALFALGEFTKAEDILNKLLQESQLKENLLQYQEAMAWLIHIYQLMDPVKAEYRVENPGIELTQYHQIFLRELFFYYFSRKEFLKASTYLELITEANLLKCFFDFRLDDIIRKLRDLQQRTENDSFLYYLFYFVRLFPEYSSPELADLLNEVGELYAYAPLQRASSHLSFAELMNVFIKEIESVETRENEFLPVASLALFTLTKMIKADRYVYLENENGNMKPKLAMNNQGQVFSPEQVLMSQTLIEKIVNNQGMVYLNEMSDNLTSHMQSSVLGLGITTLCGYALRKNNQILGIVYLDYLTPQSIDKKSLAELEIFFLQLNTYWENRVLKSMLTEKAEVTEFNELGYEAFKMIGNSKMIRDVFHKITMVADYDVNVMISGPTGSGKELVARAIHEQYSQKNKSRGKIPFVPVNCAAIPEQLLESELFGYKKGAFTGAVGDKKGKIQLADSGTLFLDEIGELPMLLQAKLLRVIQERVVTPLGSDQDFPVNIRIISATNQNLEEMIEQSTFRSDLFYRLKVVTIQLPSLKERVEDIPLLTSYFLQKIKGKFKKNINGIHPNALQYLQQKEWKGNVRELENEMERAILLCNKEYLSKEDFTGDADPTTTSIFRNLPLDWQEFKDYKQRVIDELEKKYIAQLMTESDKNIVTASKLGNLERMQIYRLLKKNE